MGLCCSRNDVKDEKSKLWKSPLSVRASPTALSSNKNDAHTTTAKGNPAINSEDQGNDKLAAMDRIKASVSKNRRRFIEGRFNLDLTYVTERIIAMAYPANSTIEAVYRNNIDDVAALFCDRHARNYRVYNLCSERTYDKTKFGNRVRVYPFEDHNPPSFIIIRSFCEDVQSWLDKDPRNVVAIHCKAGKGRTGTMICCYLLHSGEYENADDALKFYGERRTNDGEGVTIPSQIRYVRYYEQYLKERLYYRPLPLFVKSVEFRPPPLFTEPVVLEVNHRIWPRTDDDKPRAEAETSGSNVENCLTIKNFEGRYPAMDVNLFTNPANYKREQSEAIIHRVSIHPLRGDVRIEFFYKPPVTKKKKFARIWFNTFFANLNGIATDPEDSTQKKLVFNKKELDIAWKKDKNHKKLPEDIQVIVNLRIPNPSDAAESTAESMDYMNVGDNETEMLAAMGLGSPADTSEDESDDEAPEWNAGKLSAPRTSTTMSTLVQSEASSSSLHQPPPAALVTVATIEDANRINPSPASTSSLTASSQTVTVKTALRWRPNKRNSSSQSISIGTDAFETARSASDQDTDNEKVIEIEIDPDPCDDCSSHSPDDDDGREKKSKKGWLGRLKGIWAQRRK